MNHHYIGRQIRQLVEHFMLDYVGQEPRTQLEGRVTQDYTFRTFGPLVGMLFQMRVNLTNYDDPRPLKRGKTTANRYLTFLVSERHHTFIGEAPSCAEGHLSLPERMRHFHWTHFTSHDSTWYTAIENEIFKALMAVHSDLYSDMPRDMQPKPAHCDPFVTLESPVGIGRPFSFVEFAMKNDMRRNGQSSNTYWKILDTDSIKLLQDRVTLSHLPERVTA